MKIFIIIFFQILTISYSQTGWVKLNSPTLQSIEYADFLDVDFGVICTNDNYVIDGDTHVFLTKDGGLNYINITPYFSNTRFRLSSVKIINKQLILLGGEDYTFPNGISKPLRLLLESNDFGKTWKRHNIEVENLSGASQNIRDFTICNNILFASIGGGVLMSKDSGRSFQDVPFATTFNVQCNNNYIGTIDYQIKYPSYYNFEVNLQNIKDSTVNNFKINSFTVPLCRNNLLSLTNNRWAFYDYKGIYKSWDNGINWNKMSDIDLYNYTTFYRHDSCAYIISNLLDCKIYTTINFNIISNCKYPSGLPKINFIKSLDKNIAYAVGDSGLILKTIDGGGVYIDDVEEENINESSLEVYPNISSSFINLKLGYNPINAKAELINTLGVNLFSQNINSYISTLSIENLPQGLYFLKYTDKQNIFYRKVVKE